MKKAVIYFSLTVLLIFGVYVSLKLSTSLQQSPSYEGIGQQMVKESIEQKSSVESTISFDFRSYDTLGEAIIIFAAVSSCAVILKRHKDNKEDENP